MTEAVTMYDEVGGMTFFEDLVERFYEGVENDPVLRPLYPEDLAPGKQGLHLFLAQYWGGPTTYSEHRGHPRLRMRHFPFAIGPAERDAWLRHMSAAVTSGDISPDAERAMLDYFTMAAEHLVNRE
jgi:hemoglobin